MWIMKQCCWHPKCSSFLLLIYVSIWYEHWLSWRIVQLQFTFNQQLLWQEIFSSWTHKTEHFERIRRRTGVHYKSMLFFDDEYRNIEAVSCICYFVFCGSALCVIHYRITSDPTNCEIPSHFGHAPRTQICLPFMRLV